MLRNSKLVLQEYTADVHKHLHKVYSRLFIVVFWNIFKKISGEGLLKKLRNLEIREMVSVLINS